MALIDIRKARRAIQMRDMDPDQAGDMLEAILKEAVVVTASGSQTFQKKALEEIEQLRRDMLTGQVDAGARQAKLIGAYSHVADQMNNINEARERGEDSVTETLETLASNIPSADTFIAALMTANPLVGYGVKIFRDMSKGQREASKSRREQRLERQRLANEELERINQMMETESERQEIVGEQKEVVKAQKREYTRGGVYRPLLLGIRDDLHEIQDVLGIERLDTEEDMEDLGKIQKESSQDIVDAIEKTSEEQIDSIKRVRKEEERESDLQRMRESDTSSPSPIIDDVETKISKEESKGFFGSLLQGIGMRAGLLGTLGGVIGTALLKPLLGMFTFLQAVALGALKFSAVLAAPLAVAAGIYKFVEGFLHAEEILGKMDVNIAERILAGFSNIGNAFLDFVDWGFNIILKTVGLQEMSFKKFVTKTIPESFMSLVEIVSDFFDSVVQGSKNIINNIINNTLNYIRDSIQNIIDNVTNVPSLLLDKLEENRILGSLIKRLRTDNGLEDDDEISDSDIANSLRDQISDSESRMILQSHGITVPSTPSMEANHSIQRRENYLNNSQESVNINAPTVNSTNINNNTVLGGGTETNNPNSRYRDTNMRNFGLR